MTNSIRSELAIAILNYEIDNNRERLILLRDADGIEAGSFRDIDIFTYSFDPTKFIKYLEIQSFLVVKSIRRHHFYQFAVVHSSHDVILLIDIWTSLHYRGVPYFTNFSPNLVKYDNFFTLEPVQSLAISCIKCFTQTGRIKEKYLDQLRVMGLNVNTITQGSILHKRTVSITSYAVLRMLWLCKLIKYFFAKKLLVIYLLGPDGAGKTTISDHLLSSELRAKKLYFHGRIPVLPRIQKVAGAKPRKVRYNDAEKRKFTVLHAIYYTIDAILSRLFVNTMYWQDKLILCDRTHYDIVARETYRSVPRALQKLLIRALLRPDHCFLLYCSAEEINKRKPELPVSEIDSQYVAYRANRGLLNFQEVNTSEGSCSIAQIARVINEELLSNR